MRYRRLPLIRRSLLLVMATLLAACGSAPKQVPVNEQRPSTSTANKPASGMTNIPQLPKANSGKGAYYQDDGPGDTLPEGLENTVEPIPSVEAYSRSGNKPYAVFGKTYTPLTDTATPFIQRGVGSWYGKKFHGHKTSSGELYDMYKITAAHPILPIPSYARVTNLSNGKQIIVRINDRGPFHANRIIDLSYTAALKLDYLSKGSSQLEVERLLPEDIERMAENRKNQNPSLIAKTLPASLSAMPISASPGEQSAVQISIEQLLAQQSSKPVEQFAKVNSTLSDAKEKNNSWAADNSGIAGFYIQFGAFAIRANAEAVMARLKTQAESRLPGFDIVQQGSLYRLVSGPFTNRSDASAAIIQTADLGIAKPIVVQR
ncbi:septal ring lytic transglycosylase RlpA family protein [Undibacterium sp. Jales W-56]|uniref:septal ring lytic transglycosylase RlpA family protein n=1 Tax=Undibacterium sp. Jales W-56 TaxID=2897325 RepID=UPI0021D012D1|nr:septal ring lytic transglycosylase RlpA family protein [Undibacterium sp. Jales W-56]MCU6434947.1 septal ring lytic transglycosylase RlpA family protein [Undibacterium sp. Jales W-56]